MARKDRLDAKGALILVSISLVLGLNQVAVKWTAQGLQPVFLAGLRSVLATLFVWGWLAWNGRPPRLPRAMWATGALMGGIFALEFLCLFLALDLTSVSRASIIFYSMPVWLALMAHLGLAGERISTVQGLGLVAAFAGTATAILSGGGAAQAGHGSLAGDLLALGGAVCWAATAYLARRPALAAAGPEMQLFWMVLVSGPLLLAVSPAFGPLVRDLVPLHLAALVAQAAIVVSGVFIAWLWMLASYPAATVASFSFLTPVFGVILGVAVYGEPLTPGIAVAGVLVAGGIILINRRPVVTTRHTPAREVPPLAGTAGPPAR